ncbi:MAG TPA: preprotein translocase subunit SecY [Verrucomicrobiales bacterium]|nr:preprotein translocase subunit SecY [Verrucomicrobiales bacterium]
MLANILNTFGNCFKIPELKSRILFTLLVLALCRVVSMTPIPGLDGALLKQFFDQLAARAARGGDSGGSLLGMYSMFTGGALERCAVGSLGIMPYISATIIIQLLTAVVPTLSKLAREEGGRTKIIQYGRYLTVILCLGQGLVMAIGWENPSSVFSGANFPGKLVMYDNLIWYRLQTTLILTTGTMLLMWFGEQITERGIGNGISLVISIGILARMPQAVVGMKDMFTRSADGEAGGFNPFYGIALVLLLFAVIAGVIAVTQAQRKVPVQYAQRAIGKKVVSAGSSYMPLRVNYAGVMPIIFAQAILMVPEKVLGWLGSSVPSLAFLGRLSAHLREGAFLYVLLFGLMILFFSYFWVATQFNEIQIADDLKKHGGYIPGIRPGQATSQFLHNAMSRITFAGAMFLTMIAVIPILLNREMQVPFQVATFFGGTSMLILVGVMLDTMRQMESHLMMRHYDGFLKKGRIRGRF